MEAFGSNDRMAWTDAVLAATLFAIDPVALVGLSVRAFPGSVRDAWLDGARALLPAESPVRRIPLNVSDGRLLGGLDLAATLAAGRPVAERGLLAEADGGVVILAMAERLSGATAGRIGAVLDAAEVVTERDGIALRNAARLGVILLDEGVDVHERAPAALLDRLAFRLDLSSVATRHLDTFSFPDRTEVAAATIRMPGVSASDEIASVLCNAARVIGIASLRAPLLAMRVARAAAAFDGRDEVSEDDARLAARLVLAPRATLLPASDEAEEPDEAAPDPQPDAAPDRDPGDEQERSDNDSQKQLEDKVLEAAQAAIPAGLLAQLQNGTGSARARSSGRAGVLQQSAKRGRPIGARRGLPRAGARLNVIETLRAAAPWQRLRQREAQAATPEARLPRRIHVRREDFHVARFKERAETTTIFVVDASGSSALHRLAEAKGAVELLLADCYVRRDRVAVIAFRGRVAELLLPPTRSLVRAKRSLAGLPGGGGTPLAAAIDAAVALADATMRRGETPTVVLLTDGRANIARDGAPSKDEAMRDAIAAARLLRATRCASLLVDTSPQPKPQARELASEMGAHYLALPYADAATLTSAVQAAAKMPAPASRA